MLRVCREFNFESYWSSRIPT